MAWVGFERYGRLEDAQRLAYRWLYMMTTAFVDFNGVVPEKVCSLPGASSGTHWPFVMLVVSLMLSSCHTWWMPNTGTKVWTSR
jgi:hypothetical protein